MANDSYSQQALANDPTFKRRLTSCLSTIALQVLNEDPATVGHASRTGYARQVLNSPDAYVANTAKWIVMRTNLFGANTTVVLDLGVPVVQTDASDAAIQSQLATDWNLIAGI